jgi:membrane protease YdiL (CAAX protease family)
MPDQNTPAERRVPWGEIALYFIIATAVTAPFRLGWYDPGNSITLPYGFNVLFKVLRGIGPAVGFVVMRYLVRSKVPRTTSFWGVDRNSSLAAALVFPLGLAILGIENNAGISPAAYGFLGGTTFVLYALGEEFGWRGYLQQALSPLTMPPRIVVIATLWYFWHLNFLNPNIALKTHVVMYVSLLFGSWGLLKITDSTRSILFAAAVHLIFNLFADAQIDGTKRLILLFASGAVWTGLIVALEKGKKTGTA